MSYSNPGQLSPRALPRHRRVVSSFETLFGADPAAVLSAMDRAGDDVPNMTPSCAIAIDAVGLRRRDVVITIDDPFGSGDPVPAVCTVDVAARVPKTRRGVHVSRMGDAIASRASAGSYSDVSAFAAALADAIGASQYRHARVAVRARIPYLEEVHPDRVGGKLSLEHLRVMARHTCRDDATASDVGLQVTHIVACPCVQRTYEHARRIAAGGDAVPAMSLMTHSQRCVTTVMLCGVGEPAPVARMLAALDPVLVRTCNTLPRDLELASVYRAHRAPQFIEDAIRAAAMAIAEAWPSRPFRSITVRSRSQESIHEYDLTAALRLDAFELSHLDDRSRV